VRADATRGSLTFGTSGTRVTVAESTGIASSRLRRLGAIETAPEPITGAAYS
jgi:hypothetical protein